MADDNENAGDDDVRAVVPFVLLQELPEVLVPRVFSFAGDLTTSSLNRQHLQAAENSARMGTLREFADRVVQTIGPRAIVGWQTRLGVEAVRLHENYYARNDPNDLIPPHYFGIPEIPQRLYARLATSVPVRTCTIDGGGPGAVLPDGRVLLFFSGGGGFSTFCFYDIAAGTLSRRHRVAGETTMDLPLRRLDDFTLDYTNGGFVVLTQHYHNVRFTVWRLQDNDGGHSFIRVRNTSSDEMCASAGFPNGRIMDSVFDKVNDRIVHVIGFPRDDFAMRQLSFPYSIVATDIETGTMDLLHSFVMPVSTEFIPECQIGLSGESIIVAAFCNDPVGVQDIRRASLGVYVFTGQTSGYTYTPCFERPMSRRGALPKLRGTTKWNWNWIGYNENPDFDAGSPLRAVVLNRSNDGRIQPVVKDDFVPLGGQGGRRVLLLCTDSRVFLHDPQRDEGMIQIDELDITSGTRVRTLRTGLESQIYHIDFLTVAGNVLLCKLDSTRAIVSPLFHRSIIQTYLL